MFDLPSFTEIRSLMSEMKQLQFRNIKQLGNYPVSAGSYSPCQSTLHAVFLSIFPSEPRDPLRKELNLLLHPNLVFFLQLYFVYMVRANTVHILFCHLSSHIGFGFSSVVKCIYWRTSAFIQYEITVMRFTFPSETKNGQNIYESI